LNNPLGTVAALVIIFIMVGAFAAVIFTFSSAVADMVNRTKNVVTSGTIYAGEGITVSNLTLNWGTMDTNTSKTLTISVTNKLLTPITLSILVYNWSPANASQVLTLTWNYTGSVMAKDAMVPINFTLAVAPDPKGVTNFSFDISITGG
jgi:hypothetical protein